MINILDFFAKGLKNTLLLKNNGGFSHNGPWINLAENTQLDRWHVNDFVSVDYTICVDRDETNKEILKFLIVATKDTARIVEYARNNTNIDLISVDAFVNNSYVDIVVSPKILKATGAKVFFTGQYFQNQSRS